MLKTSTLGGTVRGGSPGAVYAPDGYTAAPAPRRYTVTAPRVEVPVRTVSPAVWRAYRALSEARQCGDEGAIAWAEYQYAQAMYAGR